MWENSAVAEFDYTKATPKFLVLLSGIYAMLWLL
jgi:hypothetical protein